MSGFFYTYKIPTILVLIWVLGLVTWVTLQVFGAAPPIISMGTASAFSAVLGLPAIAVGLWKWRNTEGEK